MAGRKGGLGKGLDALFVDNDTNSDSVQTLRISEIEPNKGQPRKDFDETALADLADSIREHGVIQPLLVRPLHTGGYQLIAGERRWRAARMAGLAEVPVVVRELDDRETMEIALIENLQREDLNAIEESLGYKALMEQYGMTQEQVAKSVGKSRPVVANALRLLGLPPKVLELVRGEELSPGHARAILALESKAEMEELARRVAAERLSVREVEKLVNARKEEKAAAGRARLHARDVFYDELELAAAQELGRRVKIQEKKDKGTLQIEFFSREDLADIMEHLTGEKIRW